LLLFSALKVGESALAIYKTWQKTSKRLIQSALQSNINLFRDENNLIVVMSFKLDQGASQMLKPSHIPRITSRVKVGA
jgi:hypothetical protein